MNNDRYFKCEFGNEPLTREEINQGWHWCENWNDMLVGPGMKEMECCYCNLYCEVIMSEENAIEKKGIFIGGDCSNCVNRDPGEFNFCLILDKITHQSFACNQWKERK